MALDELVIGTICGGSDGTSGITANPAVGRAFDHPDRRERDAASSKKPASWSAASSSWRTRAARPELGDEIVACVAKAARYYSMLGHGSFAVGNADGGLTTQEEKSLGAYAKSGPSPIVGIIKPGDVPPTGGLYLLDVVPDGEPRFGFPNISDNAEIGELIACGAHVILFTTGRGSVVGSAISPVIKVCANPATYRNLAGDMDVDAGRILEGRATLDEVGREVFEQTVARRARCGVEVGDAWASGVHPDVQDLRTGRAGVPAVERGAGASGRGDRVALSDATSAASTRSHGRRVAAQGRITASRQR